MDSVFQFFSFLVFQFFSFLVFQFFSFRQRFSIWIQFFSFLVFQFFSFLQNRAGASGELFFDSLLFACYVFCLYYTYGAPQKSSQNLEAKMCMKHCK